MEYVILHWHRGCWTVDVSHVDEWKKVEAHYGADAICNLLRKAVTEGQFIATFATVGGDVKRSGS